MKKVELLFCVHLLCVNLVYCNININCNNKNVDSQKSSSKRVNFIFLFWALYQ